MGIPFFLLIVPGVADDPGPRSGVLVSPVLAGAYYRDVAGGTPWGRLPMAVVRRSSAQGDAVDEHRELLLPAHLPGALTATIAGVRERVVDHHAAAADDDTQRDLLGARDRDQQPIGDREIALALLRRAQPGHRLGGREPQLGTVDGPQVRLD